MFTKKWKNVLVAVCALTLSLGSVLGGVTLNKVSADGETEVVNPIAKYEFKDETNHGKDSMGNYDLEFKKSYDTGEIMDDGTLLSGGGVSFDGNYCLSVNENNDPFKNLNAFTLRFEISQKTGNSAWASLIGWSNGTKYLGLSSQPGGNEFYIGFKAVGTKCGEYWGHAWLQNAPGINKTTGAFNEVIITVQPGGTIALYVNGQSYNGGENGAKPLPYSIPADYCLTDGAAKFAIGAAFNGAAAYASKASIRGLEIYDFAMTSDEVTQYRADGAITRPVGLKVTNAYTDLSSTLLFQESDSAETILAGSGTHFAVDAELSDGSTRRVAAKITGVEVVDGIKMLVGEIAGGVANPDGVKAYAKIGLIAEVKEIAPIAKYEFLDAENPGKDSMGNWDLVLQQDVEKKDVETMALCENGILTLDGYGALVAPTHDRDIIDYVKDFSIVTSFCATTLGGGWEMPITFGSNGWTPTVWGMLTLEGNGKLRFSMGNRADAVDSLPSNVDGTNNTYYGKELGTIEAGKFYTLAFSFDFGGKVNIYLDGVNKYSYDLPEDYILNSGSGSLFAIGGLGRFGNVYSSGDFQFKTVSIYDFALTDAQIATALSTGKLESNSLLTESWIESIDTELTFADGVVVTKELYEAMSSEEKASLMGSATVVATLSNLAVQKTTITLPVIWTGVEEVEGKWIAKGYVKNTGNSLPAISTAKVEVSCEVPVTPSYEINCGEIANGALTPEKTWGLEGDSVVIAIEASEHYEISKVYANGVEILPVEGVYTVVVGTEDIVLTADFVPHQYAITLGEMELGTVEIQDGTTGYNDVVTLIPVPDKYHVVTSVMVNGEIIAPGVDGYTFKVEGDAVITATFAEATYSVDAFVVGANGTVAIAGDVTTSKGGETLVIEVTPDEGFVIEYVKVNGEAIQADEGIYSFVVESDSEIEVKFTEYVEPAPATKSCKSAIGSTGALVSLVLLACASFVTFKKKD